jgi:peptide deformylase
MAARNRLARKLDQPQSRASSTWRALPVSIKPIRLFGDPVLRTAADPVTDFDAELRRLVADLTDTMQDAPGLGLAAPQIGVGLRVFTYYVDDILGHLINPNLDLSADEETDDEGCLSFPGVAFPTKRSYGVVAKGFNMHGEPVTIEGSGLLARCVQHETDHLDGVLFIDRLDPEQRKLAMKEIRAAEWWGEQVPAVKISPHLTHGKAL